jgi:hypothetical protein
MRYFLLLIFLPVSTLLFAQLDSVALFLQRSLEKELALQSGEVVIKDQQFYRDTLVSEVEKKLTFLHEPGNMLHYYILDDGKEGAFFSNGENIEYYYNGFRRKWPSVSSPDFYKWRFMTHFDDLTLGFEPGMKANRPFENFLSERVEHGDSMISWNASTSTLRIKVHVFSHPTMSQYYIREYTFNSDSLLARVAETMVMVLPDTTLSDGNLTIRHYSYSRLDQVPYFSIRQQLKEYQNAPLMHVFRPEGIEIKHPPKPGLAFPDLMLMDGLGSTKKLSSIPGPKILVYPFVPSQNQEYQDVFAFIDSMEDIHSGWTFMLISQQNIDELDYYQKTYPEIRSFYLASKVEGLELNGWPVWFIVDQDGLLLAENHGYQPVRNKEFDEWIKEHLGED